MDNKAKATNDTEREQGQEERENNNNNNNIENELRSEESQVEEERGSNLDQQQSSRRTPFTNLSQVDADLVLARTLQEQERAYMMLRMNNDGSDYGSWEVGSYLHDEDDDFDGADDESDANDNEHNECDAPDDDDDDDDDDEVEDAFDVHAHDEDDDDSCVEYDSDVFSSDEAYARAIQDAEEREMAARLLALAGIHDLEGEVDTGGNSQDTWEEVDPDELSYEELLALGEVVGTESRGLSTDTITSLPTVNYKTGSSQHGSNDSCVICHLDYEDGETLTVLSCKHLYHSECINSWLKIKKVCPVCSTEVSTSGHS